MGLLFYPRGGSAQVARYLSRALQEKGWSAALLSGSLGKPGEPAHAPTFYAGIDVTTVDYDPAIQAYHEGKDPLAEPVPVHPSFEDQVDVPDRVFAAVSPELGDHLASAWARIMAERWTVDPPLIHLHHLTPLHEAVQRTWPECPLVTHLHGTEMKMLDRIERLAWIAESLGLDLPGMADRAEAGALPAADGLLPEQRELFEQTRWQRWRFGGHWAKRLRSMARFTDRFVVISPHDRDEAHRLLPIEEGQIEWIPDGVDIKRFDRQTLTPDERLGRWRHWLIEDPRGWDESGEPGSIRYREHDLRHFVDPHTGEPAPVLLYVGRFLEFKHVPLLVRAYARARPSFEAPAPLVIWGGFPGEFEGEHPSAVAREQGVDGVFFLGWRGHDDLPNGLACADLLVAPSVDEPFGQVYLEAMACALPVIATRSGGPLSYVNTEPGRPNGWLVEPDDLDALVEALVEAVNNPDERRERGENAYRQVQSGYSWHSLSERFVAVYEAVMS
jgi:D-inositol-3-phosphate glycosyltransferase